MQPYCVYLLALFSQLGLVQGGEAQVETAAGVKPGRIFRDVELSIGERQGTFDCLELTDVPYALLGVTPMEVLGLEPDLKNRKLRILPMNYQERQRAGGRRQKAILASTSST